MQSSSGTVKTRLDVEENPLINTSATFPFIFFSFSLFFFFSSLSSCTREMHGAEGPCCAAAGSPVHPWVLQSGAVGTQPAECGFITDGGLAVSASPLVEEQCVPVLQGGSSVVGSPAAGMTQQGLIYLKSSADMRPLECHWYSPHNALLLVSNTVLSFCILLISTRYNLFGIYLSTP